MLRFLSRFVAGAGVALALVNPLWAQYSQQRTDDLGIMSAPSSATQAPGAATIQGAQPLPIPQSQSPTITNNPDYPRQPIFVPAPYLAPIPGQLPGQLAPGQLAPQQQTRTPQAPAADQRGQGAFAAPRDASLLERNEFQNFISSSTGHVLPIFGHNLFEAPTTFAPVENIPVTPDYVIGPGDELLIRAWGQIEIDYRAAVDRTGMINIPRVGAVPVAGVRYQDITDQIRKAIARNFRNFDLSVSMGQLRAVQIFVVGHARRPGNYTVSSLSTLVNAIFSAGGPSTRGSMRGIQLKRGNTVVTEFDMYELLLTGDKSRDAALLPGDVIYFPPVGELAAVSGSVNNPAIFELKGPTNVNKLLELAGGLSTTAQIRQVTLERIDERKTRSVDQFDLDYDGLRRTIKDGDLVSVLAISPRFENAVTLRGNVATPLRYPYRPGMRVLDLIPEKEALLTPDYYRRKNLYVRMETVTQSRLSSEVRRLSEEVNWDYAVIERLNQKDLTTELIHFNLGKAVLESDPENNLPLMPGDVVTVFSKSDVVAASGKRTVVVSLEGEFAFAGVYQAHTGETLRQLVKRVGGVTSAAYLFGAEFMRDSARRNQEERLRQAIVQYEQDLQRAAATRARNVTSAEEAQSLKAEAEAQQAALARIRTLRPTGRIVLELPENPTVENLPDIALEDGDRLLIPQRPSMVSVFGTVFNESAFLYRDDKTVSDYLAQAGGPRKEADQRSIYVLRADGSVVSKRALSFFSSLDRMRPTPGDAIVVPEDLTRTSWMKDLTDWTRIFYQFGLGVAALQVIKNY